LERIERVNSRDLHPLLDEADELSKIIAKSIITAKRKGK